MTLLETLTKLLSDRKRQRTLAHPIHVHPKDSNVQQQNIRKFLLPFPGLQVLTRMYQTFFSLAIQHYLSRSSVSDTTTYETDVPVNGGLTRKCAPLIANELIGTHQVLDALTQSHFIGQTVIDCALYNLAQCDDNISAIPSAVWTPQQGEAPISAWNKYYDKRHHLSSKEHPHLTILPIINDRHWTVLVRYSFGYVQHGNTTIIISIHKIMIFHIQ